MSSLLGASVVTQEWGARGVWGGRAGSGCIPDRILRRGSRQEAAPSAGFGEAVEGRGAGVAPDTNVRGKHVGF